MKFSARNYEVCLGCASPQTAGVHPMRWLNQSPEWGARSAMKGGAWVPALKWGTVIIQVIRHFFGRPMFVHE